MSLPEGSRVFICYDLPPPLLWHERYILAACACGRGWHIVMTPDLDVFPELISLENEDISGFRLGLDGGLPMGLTVDNTYRFRQLPGAEEMTQFRRDARHAGRALAYPPGAGAHVAAPAAGVAAASDEVGEACKWLVVETSTERQRGDEVTLDGSEVVHGDVGLKQSGEKWFAIRKVAQKEVSLYAGREASADARLLGLTFQEGKRDERQWREVAKDSNQESFEDWNVPGPRTSSWCLKFINRRNGGPNDHHRFWMQTHGLDASGWGVQEHEHLSKIVDRLGRFDGLDLANLAGVELIFRRLQLIEYFYSEKGPGGGKGGGKGDKKDKKQDEGNYKAEAAVFAGTHREFGDVMVAPELLDYVSKEIEKDASVMKQVRKAREERQAASK